MDSDDFRLEPKTSAAREMNATLEPIRVQKH
jgi:hypothetical protein